MNNSFPTFSCNSIRLRRSRSAAAYRHQTFQWTICRSVRMYVRVSVGLSSALWKNGGSDSYAVWHHKSDGSTDEADSGVWGSVQGRGIFGGKFRAPHCNQRGLYGVRVRQCRDAALFPNYFGQTCLGIFCTPKNVKMECSSTKLLQK